VHEVIRQFFDFGTARPYIPTLLRGFWVTLQIALLAEALCLGLGLVLAIMRRFRPDPHGRGLPMRVGAAAVRGIAIVYINVFRGVPALLVLLLMFASFPFLPIPVVKSLSEFQIGVIGLGLVYAAYIAEVYRAGIESVDRGQTEAARSLGMSVGQTMRLIVLPQAVRRVLPPLMNDFIALTKDVALVSVISVNDVVYEARAAQATELNATTLTIAGLFYLVFTLPLIWALDRFIGREQRRTLRGSAVT
jgi:polar amino acid transport system permease protein